MQISTGRSLDHGRCHRFPPPGDNFPLVHRQAFCGEFTPRTYASVARVAGAQLGMLPAAPASDRAVAHALPAALGGEVLNGEIAATIAAAVAMVIDGPHRILDVQPVAPAAFGPWPFGAVLNTWALEGRVQHFSSHRLR